MKGRYEIRIYNKRYNMHPYYYTGKKDIKLSIWCATPEELMSKWDELLEDYEGDTYSVWDSLTDEIITGGAYDPNDWQIIEEYFEEDEEDCTEYDVEFTTTITVKAKNKSEAIAKAKMEFDTGNDNQFYIYCNGKSCN